MELEIKKIYCIDCLNFKGRGNKATCKYDLIPNDYGVKAKRYFRVKKEDNKSYLYEHGKSIESLVRDECLRFVDMND